VRYRRGQILDTWGLARPLGAGGNGEVWRASREGAPEVSALKIFRVRNPNRDAYPRFRAEVEFLRGCTHAGVLPLRDASVPEHPSDEHPAWLATPVATKASKALKRAELAQVVEAVSVWARTLAYLAREDVSHRDIKPDNLFLYQHDWMIGDWGLVSYPDKEAVTRPGHRVGPMWFIAPEMLSDPEHADGRLADVYSLAKTLWVLAAGQRWPVTGGTIRRDEPDFRLSTVVTDEAGRSA
jgi:serine/threonine protein kinase